MKRTRDNDTTVEPVNYLVDVLIDDVRRGPLYDALDPYSRLLLAYTCKALHAEIKGLGLRGRKKKLAWNELLMRYATAHTLHQVHGYSIVNSKGNYLAPTKLFERACRSRNFDMMRFILDHFELLHFQGFFDAAIKSQRPSAISFLRSFVSDAELPMPRYGEVAFVRVLFDSPYSVLLEEVKAMVKLFWLDHPWTQTLFFTALMTILRYKPKQRALLEMLLETFCTNVNQSELICAIDIQAQASPSLIHWIMKRFPGETRDWEVSFISVLQTTDDMDVRRWFLFDLPKLRGKATLTCTVLFEHLVCNHYIRSMETLLDLLSDLPEEELIEQVWDSILRYPLPGILSIMRYLQRVGYQFRTELLVMCMHNEYYDAASFLLDVVGLPITPSDFPRDKKSATSWVRTRVKEGRWTAEQALDILLS